MVAVATFYKGMGQKEIEGAITLRLEQLYLQASYVEHIESRSMDGISLIKVYFHSEYDVNAGLAEITSLTYSALRYSAEGDVSSHDHQVRGFQPADRPADRQ